LGISNIFSIVLVICSNFGIVTGGTGFGVIDGLGGFITGVLSILVTSSDFSGLIFSNRDSVGTKLIVDVIVDNFSKFDNF
jgi:hypothetical protein